MATPRTRNMTAAGADKPGELKRGKKETGGNVRADNAWLAAVQNDLQSPDVSNRPEGWLYDVQFQWRGYAEDINTDFFIPFIRKSISGRPCPGVSYIRDETGMYVVDLDWNRLRRPCLALPMKGGMVCRAHGGEIPAVKEAAQRALAEASEVAALRLVGLTDPQVNDLKVQLGAINSILDRVGIKGGMELEVRMPGYKRVLNNMFSDDDETPEPQPGNE